MKAKLYFIIFTTTKMYSAYLLIPGTIYLSVYVIIIIIYIRFTYYALYVFFLYFCAIIVVLILVLWKVAEINVIELNPWKIRLQKEAGDIPSKYEMLMFSYWI